MLTEDIKNKYQIQREKAAADLAEIKNIITLIEKKDSQIKEKCDFLQTLVDSLPTPIYVKDLNLRYKVCNDALAILMGVNRESIIGKTLTEIYSDNDESRFMYEKDMELLENGGTQTFDYEIAGIGKHPQILNFNRSIFRDENRQIAGIIGSCFDITDRVKKEKELRVEREKFYNAFDQSPIPKVIIQYGTGLILEINETALEMFGFTREEIKDKTVYDLRTNSGKSLIKDYQDFTQEFFLSQLDENNGRIKSIDIIIYTKNDEEKVIALSASKYRVNGGFCVLSILKDITYRVLAENKVKQIQRNYEIFFNTINEFLFVLDENGNIIHMNSTVIDRLGYTKEELKCMNIISLHPIERQDDTKKIIRDMLDKIISICPIPIITKQGIQIPVETKIAHGVWNDKPVIFGVSKDISDLKLSEEKFSKLFYINPTVCGLSEFDSHRYIDVNEAFYTLLGFEKDEVIGKTVHELNIITHDQMNKILLNADINGNIKNIESDIRSKNGNIKHVIFSSESFFVQDKKYRFVVVQDITERKRMEQENIKIKEEWEETFNVVPELIAILDNDHTIIRVNKSFTDRFNNSMDYFIGKKCYEIVHNNDNVPEECPHAQLLLDGKQHVQEGYDNLLKGYFIVTCSPIFNDNKELIGSVHSMIDITKRKETEDKLKEISEQYQTAIELSNDAVAIVQDGKHVFVNKRFLEIFGIDSFEDIIGKEYINVYHNDIEFVRDINRRRTEGLRVPSKYEFRGLKLGDRRSMCIEVSAAKITYKGRVATLSYLRDVTERKRYEQFQNLPISTLDTIEEMVCRHDSNFKFTYANETYCKFIGKTREKLETMTLFDFMPSEEVERVKDYLASFSVNKTSSSIVNKVILYSGEIVYIYWMNRAFFDSDNQLIELQSIGRVSDVFEIEDKSNRRLDKKNLER